MDTHSDLVMDSTGHPGKAVSGVRARTIEDVKLELLNYFAALGAAPDHIFTIRDFNSQVMMNAYSPGERAMLGYALQKLLDDRILVGDPATGYLLTDAGQAMIKAKRREQSFPRHDRSARWGVTDPSQG